MKIDVARQPLFPAAAVLVLAAVAGFACGGASIPHAVVAAAAPTAEWLVRFEMQRPILSFVTAGVLLLGAGLTVGRIGVRYNLYSVGSCLGVSLYGLLACGILIGGDYLAGMLAAFLLARVFRFYCASLRNGYTFDALFRGSFSLGLLPLVYPPALVFVPLAGWALVCFKRTLREAVVTFAGLLLPAALAGYLWWAVAGSFAEPFAGLWQVFLASGGLTIFDPAAPAVPALLCFVLFLVLCAALFFLSERYASGTRVRAILFFDLGALALSALLFLVPSATASIFALAAVPAALLLPFLFVRIRPVLAAATYLTLLLLCVIRCIL